VKKFTDTTINKARQLFSERSGEEYSEERTEGALSNLISFVNLLVEWESKNQTKPQKKNEGDEVATNRGNK
jgi:hypothetical protein